MCGIAGLINDKNIDENYLNKITKSLYNRGPNNQDFWLIRKEIFVYYILDFQYLIYLLMAISQ